jgi:hypothetical protein
MLSERPVTRPSRWVTLWCALVTQIPDPGESRPLLTRLIDRSHQALLASPTMQSYLQSVGVPDRRRSLVTVPSGHRRRCHG